MAYASNFDAWLEAPYTRAAAEEAAYERFCEERNLDFDSIEAETAWNAHKDALYAAEEADYDFGPLTEDA
jgi:hypothetical protein